MSYILSLRRHSAHTKCLIMVSLRRHSAYKNVLLWYLYGDTVHTKMSYYGIFMATRCTQKCLHSDTWHNFCLLLINSLIRRPCIKDGYYKYHFSWNTFKVHICLWKCIRINRIFSTIKSTIRCDAHA